MTAHVHAWQPTIAPDYVCTEAGCGAVARRGRHGGGIRVVARDAAEAELHDRTYSMLARTALAEAEGWRRDEGRQGDRSPAVDEHLAGAREEDRRMPTTRHAWDDRDEAALRAAVETVTAEPDDDGPPAGRHPRVLLWHAVAGILLGDGLRVSPDACRTRWALMEERERRAREAAELARQEREDAVRLAAGDGGVQAPAGQDAARVVVDPDAWAALAIRIAAWEAEAADELTAALCGLRSDVGGLDLRVRAWEGRLERIEALLAALAAAWDVTP